jgi:hypothetical protein
MTLFSKELYFFPPIKAYKIVGLATQIHLSSPSGSFFLSGTI